MKTVSEETTESILAAAKKEFLEYGFLNASLRRISSACNVSTHTIYTRFAGKEGLFDALVKETADELFGIYKASVSKAYSPDYHAAYGQSDEGTHAMLEYVYKHFDEMKLIISCSKGCSYEHYLEKFVEIEEKFYEDFINKILKLEKPVNRFFFHMLSQRSFNIFNEVIENNMTYEEARDYLETMVQFNLGGLSAVLGIGEN